jgi:hypothetical protein
VGRLCVLLGPEIGWVAGLFAPRIMVRSVRILDRWLTWREFC